MTKLEKLSAVAAACAIATVVSAADYSDPTWPCIQRKVEALSPGLMWPHPVEPSSGNHDISKLAELLALRRVELDSLHAEVATFAAEHDGDPQALGEVFAVVFESLSKRRTRIIGGIADFSLSQIALAEKIDTARAEMDNLLAVDNPDYDRIDALEEQIDWDQVIYSDRQRSITYLCETPQLLEKRLFAIARLLQANVKDDG